MATIIDKLTAERESWKESVKIRTATRNALKTEIRKVEQHLKETKIHQRIEIRQIETQIKNLKKYERKTARDVKEAKTQIIKYYNKMITLPSQLRYRTKKNIGKAINKIMEEQQWKIDKD